MSVATNLVNIKKTIASHATKSAELIAVSKYQSKERIGQALDAGHRVFGENRVQEASQKWPLLKEQHSDIILHMIGPLQSNKVKQAIELFDVIQTLDRKSLIKALAKELANGAKLPSLYIQVNIGSEPQKAGVLPGDLDALMDMAQSSGLKIDGIMCIPPKDKDPKPYFMRMVELQKRYKLSNLSMGMSADFEEAVTCGATHVRVGTAVFGKREQ